MKNKKDLWDFRGLWIGALIGGVGAILALKGLQRVLLYWKVQKILSRIPQGMNELNQNTVEDIMASLYNDIKACRQTIIKTLVSKRGVASSERMPQTIEAYTDLSKIDENHTVHFLELLNKKVEDILISSPKPSIATRDYIGMMEALNQVIGLWMADIAVSGQNPSSSESSRKYIILDALRFLRRGLDGVAVKMNTMTF